MFIGFFAEREVSRFLIKIIIRCKFQVQSVLIGKCNNLLYMGTIWEHL